MVARSLEELRRWFDNCPAFVAVHEGPEHRYAYVNPVIERVLPDRQIIGKPVREVIPELEGQGLFERMDRTYRTGEISVENEMRIVVGEESQFHRRGNAYFNHILQPWRGEDGKVQGIVSLAFDITDLVNTKEKLAKSQERFRVALAPSPVTVFSHDRDLAYTWIFNSSVGFPAEEIIGKTDRDLLSLEDAEKLEALKMRVLQSGQNLREEISLTYGDSVHYFDLYMESIRDSNGRVTGISGAGVDITDRKKLEEQLTRANLSLEDQVQRRTVELHRRMNQLRQLSAELTMAEERERERLAGVLHDDLQQYLTVLKVGLERFEDRVDSDQQESIRSLVSATDTAIRISRSLSAELTPRTLHAQGLIPALKWLKNWMENNYQLDVKLNLEPSAEPSDQFIRSLIFGAVKELLLNSVKHGRASEAGIRFSQTDLSMELSVWDNGQGFAESVSDDGESATGLGFSMIRRRIESIGGQVQMPSTSGPGSRVDISIPKEQDIKAVSGPGGLVSIDPDADNLL